MDDFKAKDVSTSDYLQTNRKTRAEGLRGIVTRVLETKESIELES